MSWFETPLQAALTYAARGWPVFPCHTISPHPIGPAGCTCHHPDCHSPGKHPAVARGLHAATVDRTRIRTWWQQAPERNVAVRTGGASGLVVIDIDPAHGGLDSLRHLVATHGRFPAGPRVRTGSGGWHLCFAHPGIPVRNAAGTRFGTGIDVRGDGGYVIAAPSRHASGAQYAWHDYARPLPELPDWTLERLVPPTPSPDFTRHRPLLGRGRDAWARAALDGEANAVRHALVGSRNQTLNRAAFCLGQIVATGALDATVVETVLVESALHVGLGEREARRTLRSGLDAGMTHPRAPRVDAPVVAEVDVGLEL